MSSQALFNNAQAVDKAPDQGMPMNTLSILGVLSIVAVGMAGPTNATLLVQEDFNYAPGAYTAQPGGLMGNSWTPNITMGAAGFSSNWSWMSASVFGIGAADATHTDGSYYKGSASTNGQWGQLNTISLSPTPTYVSLLVGKTGANSGDIAFWDGWGYNVATLTINSSGNYSVTAGDNPPATVATAVAVNPTGFDQILMEITNANGIWVAETVNLWVNPNWSNPGAPTASATGMGNYNIAKMLLDGGGIAVDRIRIGTTLADVQTGSAPSPPADANTSTVTAAPASVPADGSTTATITVTLLDATSAPVAGKTVSLASSRGAADTISAASGPSNIAGVVTFTVKSTTPGTPVFTATDGTDSVTLPQTATVTFTANPVASAVNSTVAASPSPVVANGISAGTITVTLRDGGSVPVAGKTVSLASSRGATDTISAASGMSNASGVVTFTVTSLTIGAPVFTATDVTDANLPITATATLTFTAVPSGSLLLQEDFNYPAGVSTSQAGGGGWGNSYPNITQGAAGFGGNWDWNAAGAKFGISAGDANHSDGTYYDGSKSTNGQHAALNIALSSNTPAYLTMLFGKTGTNSGDFVFWDHGGHNVATLTINSSGNYALTVGQGSTVSTSIPVNASGFDQILMTITRANQDIWGNAAVNLWVNPNWSSLGAPAATGTGATGYPDIGQWLMDAGGMAVDRVRVGTSLIDVQIKPADAGTSTIAASPSSVQADGINTSTITVTLLDAASTPIPGKTVTLVSNRGATDTISSASGSSNAFGVVTFTVKSTTPGTPVFTATDVTDNVVITATASVNFTAVPPANAATSTVSASPASQRADGVNIATITVTLLDGGSAPIPGKTVTLASSRGPTDTISAASGVSNISGVVTFTVKATTPGTPVFTATDVTDGVTATHTATVNFTVNPPASASLSTVEASPSTVVADGTSPSTFTVTLRDGGSVPLAGKTVTLASNRAAGIDTISAASGTSDTSGMVTFTVTSLADGAAVFTATNTTDVVIVSQTATVTFTPATNVIDISNAIGPAVEGRISIDTVVPVGYSGRLVGVTDAYWATGGVARNLNLNGNTLTFESGGGNPMNISGAISGNGMVRVNAGGIGIFHISGNVGNTYTGTTEINNGPVKLEKSSGNALCGTITVNGTMSNAFPDTGVLWWAANNQISDASNLTLAAGASLNPAGYSDTMGTISLAAYAGSLTGDAGIFLGGSTSILRFANSSAQSWASGTELIIREWNGSPAGGGSEGVFFGNSAAGLSANQIAKTGFMNPAGFATGLYHATILDSGEVVPTGSAVLAANPPYDLSPQAAAARAAIYTSNGRANLTAAGTPLADGTRIVFFGDSITWGGGYITPLNTAIAGGAGTQGKTVTLINRGINGGTTANIRDGVAGGQASFASLLVSDQADIAVIYIGINDIWWAGTTAADYEQGLRDMAATAAALGVPVVFVTPAAHGESPLGAGGDDPKIDQFATIVQRVAADTGSAFVNLRAAFVAWWMNNNYEIRLDGSYSPLVNYGLLTYDGIHPSFPGLDIVADHIADGILASLTSGSAFDTWIGTATGGRGLTGAAAAFDADPDHDGLPNGIEFVLGGEPNPANPGSNSRALLPTAASVGNNLVFTYIRTHAAAYLNPVVEFNSGLLGAWTTATDPGNATIAVVPGDTSDTITVTIPKGSNRTMFVRLKVGAP